MFVYAEMSGWIGFGGKVPESALTIAYHQDTARLRRVVEVVARHAKPEKGLLVPGMPEAEDADQALDAFLEFRRMVHQRLRPDAGRPTEGQ